MSIKEDFIEYVENLKKNQKEPFIEETEEIKNYWQTFCNDEIEKDKPMFTDNGKIILKFLQEHESTSLWKSKSIAEELGISSRTVSGAMRKLVTDNFVEKVGKDPAIYTISEKGKNIEID